VSNQGSTFAANVALANLLSVQVFGEYAMVQSTIAVLSLLGQLATGYTATKYVAEFRTSDPSRAGRLVGMLALLSTGMAAIVSVTLFVGAPWLASVVLEQPTLAGGLRVAASALCFVVMNGFVMGVLAGLESYAALGRACVISGTLYFLATVLGGSLGGIEGALAGAAIGGAIQCALLWRGALAEAGKQGIRIRSQWCGGDAHIIASFALPAALNGFMSVPAMWFGNAVLVRQEAGYQAMALFTAANSFRIIVLFLPNVVNNVNMSLLNYQVGLQDGRRYTRVFWVNLGVTMAVASGTAATATVFGPWLLTWFGEEFRVAFPVLLVLMLAAVPESLSLALLQIIQSRARIWFTFAGVSLPAYATLALVAWMLTPAQGALGLAWAYVAAAGVAVVANAFIVRHLGIRLADLAGPSVQDRREAASSRRA